MVHFIELFKNILNGRSLISLRPKYIFLHKGTARILDVSPVSIGELYSKVKTVKIEITKSIE